MLNMDRDNNLKLIKEDVESGKYGGQYVNDGGMHYYVVAIKVKEYVDSTGHDVLFTKVNVNGALY